jgi:hypothetical protein
LDFVGRRNLEEFGKEMSGKRKSEDCRKTVDKLGPIKRDETNGCLRVL